MNSTVDKIKHVKRNLKVLRAAIEEKENITFEDIDMLIKNCLEIIEK